MCLNSLADDKLTASVRCLSPNGHLLEIGKYDILKGTALSMRPMHDNITFHGINLDSLFKGAQKEAVSHASCPCFVGFVSVVQVSGIDNAIVCRLGGLAGPL